MKVFIAPTYRNKKDNAEGGVRRVSEALWRYLPDYGVTPTDSPDGADLLNLHGAMLVQRPGVPIVASNHGLYWAEYHWDAWAHETNQQVRALLQIAQAVTAPSRWVAHALARGMLLDAHVIYHGVDPAEWKPERKHGGYVLWNKARSDAVSDPEHMQALAELLPDVSFVSTLGRETANVHLCGVLSLPELRPVIRRAALYLATARETFGIGTLEALSCGVPVVGWDYGGQREIVVPGETGYLAPYGDYTALAGCVRRALAERARLADNARADVLARWTWPDKIARYAELFKRVHADWHAPRPKVSVIVTAHNLARYLPDALESVLAQTFADWECLIVDDDSQDGTDAIGHDYAARDHRFTYLRTPTNLKLSGARNFGFSHSRGRYVLHLDADDMLDAGALAVLSQALDTNPALHIAYGHLDTVNHEGAGRQRNPWPPKAYDYHQQLAHLNQLPYAALMRREVLERVGGYRRRAWRAEDAELWCRATSFGFRAAKVTEAATLIYRVRSDSKSGEEGREHPDRDGDWTAWYPWRLAGNAQDGLRLAKRNARTPLALTPWGAQGEPPAGSRFWRVPHYAAPEVSVIIPVGPGHERYVLDAVESVMAQTAANWEVVVVNDTGKLWSKGENNPLAGAPYAKVIQPAQAGQPRGAGAARNAGAAAATAPLLVFLDADDYLLPAFLSTVLAEWRASGRLVYTDSLIARGRPGQPLELLRAEDYECARLVEDPEKPTGWRATGVLNRMQHTVTCLVPRAAFAASGGFDESMRGWEDWDFFIRLAATGLCSVRVPEPLFVYRVGSGQRRRISEANNDALRRYLYERWKDYYQGVKEMACGSCPGGVSAPQPPPVQAADDAPPDGAVKLEYRGASPNTITVIGQASGTRYRVNNNSRKQIWVRTDDAAQPPFTSTVHGQPQFVNVMSARPAPPAMPAVVEAPAPEKPLPDMAEYAGRKEASSAPVSSVPVSSAPLANLPDRQSENVTPGTGTRDTPKPRRRTRKPKDAQPA